MRNFHSRFIMLLTIFVVFVSSAVYIVQAQLSPIQPILSCVLWNDDGSYTALFSYDNPNNMTLTIPEGENNTLSPTPLSGVPVDFEPGNQPAFAVTFYEGSTVTWLLHGNSVTASADVDLRCESMVLLPLPLLELADTALVLEANTTAISDVESGKTSVVENNVLVAQDASIELVNVDGIWANGRQFTNPADLSNVTPACYVELNTANQFDENQVIYGNGIYASPPCYGQVNPSGFGFDGNESITVEPGVPFIIGEYTHYNNPLAYSYPPLRYVDLNVTLEFGGVLAGQTANYAYLVQLEETSNNGFCDYGYRDGYPYDCNDRVIVENTTLDQIFVIDDVEYTLQVRGFVPGTAEICDFNSSQVNSIFITEERTANHACLIGQILVAEPAITLTKTLNQTNPVEYGSDVTFNIAVQNNGNTPLQDILLSDPQCSSMSSPVSDLATADFVTMQEGETWTYTCTINGVTENFTNVAQVNGESVGLEEPVSAQDDAFVEVLPPVGSLEVVKAVEWYSESDPSQSFTIQVKQGEAVVAELLYGSDGGSQTVSDLAAGVYTVSEIVPSGWAATGNYAVVEVFPNQTTSTTITNTQNPPLGSLLVTKEVEWLDDANEQQSFTIFVKQGDSIISELVFGFDGGSVVVPDLAPGIYTVSESVPDGWTAIGNHATVEVFAGTQSSVTITNEEEPTGFVCNYSEISPLDALEASHISISYDEASESFIATVQVTNNSLCEYEVGMAAYHKTHGGWIDALASTQKLVSWTPEQITPELYDGEFDQTGRTISDPSYAIIVPPAVGDVPGSVEMALAFDICQTQIDVVFDASHNIGHLFTNPANYSMIDEVPLIIPEFDLFDAALGGVYGNRYTSTGRLLAGRHLDTFDFGEGAVELPTLPDCGQPETPETPLLEIDPIEDAYLFVGQQIAFAVSDTDGDEIVACEILGLPGATAIVQGGICQVMIDTTGVDPQTYATSLSLTGSSTNASASFDVAVLPVPDFSMVVLPENTSESIALPEIEIGGIVAAYDLGNLPDWASFDPSTKILTFNTPEVEVDTIFNISVTVTALLPGNPQVMIDGTIVVLNVDVPEAGVLSVEETPDEQLSDDPATEEPLAEEPITAETTPEASPTEEVVTEEPITEEPAVEEVTPEIIPTEEPAVEEVTPEASDVEEPVPEETEAVSEE